MPAVVERARARLTARRSLPVAVAVVVAAGMVAATAHRYGFAGLAVDVGALRSWLAGDGLYAYRDPDSHLGTALSPVAALLLAPFALLPVAVTGWLLAAGGLAALALALVFLAGPVARRYGRDRWPVVAGAFLAALALEPVRATLGLGHLDLIVFGLVVADVIGLRRRAWARSRATWWPGRDKATPPRGLATGAWAGAGVGIATALAVGPALFIGYLVLTRQWRPALTAAGTAATLAAATLLVAPRESAAWFGEVLWRFDRTGAADRVENQSLAGVLARLYDSPTTPVLLWSSFAMLLVAVGLIRARSAHGEGDEIAAFTLVGLTGAVVGPVTPTHELVWVLPALVLLVDAAARRRVRGRRSLPGLGNRWPGAGYAAAAAFVLLLFLIAPMWTLSGAGPLALNAYALVLIVLVNALPWRPGVAPAFPVNRWPRRRPAARRIPPARRPSA